MDKSINSASAQLVEWITKTTTVLTILAMQAALIVTIELSAINAEHRIFCFPPW